MRIQKLGSRFLRVVTPDRKVHYFSMSGLFSLRVFWIFRNFSNIDDRVLSTRQLRLIQQICSSTEIARGSVDFESLIGTVELSTTFSPGLEKSKTAAAPSPVPLESIESTIAGSQALWIPSTVVSAAGVAACVLVLVTLFANVTMRHHVATALSHSFKSMASMLPRAPRESSSPQQASEQTLPQPSLVKVAVPVRDQNKSANAEMIPTGERVNGPSSLIGTEEGTELRPATLLVASLSAAPAVPVGSLKPERSVMVEAHTAATTTPARSHRKSAAVASPAIMPEALPPSGPPQSHPVPTDFPEVSSDTKVILRAIVSADGKVARVHVVEGNPALAREAARAVTSWRYSPRSTGGDAESRIVFQFAPDVTTISFLNDATPKIVR